MEVRDIDWTQTVRRNGYTAVVSGVKPAEQGRGGPSGDTVTISEEGRQVAIAAEMEKSGLSHEAAAKLASGRLTINIPDGFKLPTLEAQADHSIYHDAYFKALVTDLDEIREEVESYYAPEHAKLQGMDDAKAMDHLFKTYMMPYMEDVFLPGTPLPPAPKGMGQEEARMAYDQLKRMRFGHGVLVADRYALGEAGMERLRTAEDRAKQTAREAMDAAQREVDARQAAFDTQREERSRQTIAGIDSGAVSGTCMGYMALRKDEGAAG